MIIGWSRSKEGEGGNERVRQIKREGERERETERKKGNEEKPDRQV